MNKKTLTCLAFALPAIIFMVAMVIQPIAYNIVLSFQDVTLRNLTKGDRSFIGLDTYRDVISTGTFPIGLRNTFFFTVVALLFQFPLGFALALLFSKRFPLVEPMRGFLLVAWMLPTIAVSGVFKYMFGTDTGIINYFLTSLGMVQQPIRWLSTGSGAMAAVIITNVWKNIPFNMILLATALTTIPADIYEAAAIDGASPVQRFFRITVPMIKPAILSVVTLGFIYTFKVFDLVYIMTGGGPANATEMLSTLAYRYSFDEYNFSKGAATANILFLILLVVGIIYINIGKKEE